MPQALDPSMPRRMSPGLMAQTLGQALKQGMLQEQDTAVLILDMDMLNVRIKELFSHFPASTLHAVAVKANPLLRVLAHLAGLGLGLEAASLNELHLALDAGCPRNRIVFDSPAKTVGELKFALSIGVSVNADNFQELDRIADLLADKEPAAPIGLRVNPQVGQGRIPCTSVASDISKFGVPLEPDRHRIIEQFKAHAWLTALHSHVGSQGCSLDQLVEAAKRLHGLTLDINQACGREQVARLDIGGGLPAPYKESDIPTLPGLAEYAQALHERVPGLMAGDFQLVTEFGRHVHANAAFAATRVEYVKEQAGQRTAITHLGADMFLRTCYQPEYWPLELSVHDPSGALKSGPLAPQHVAGPLCFAGDYLAADAMLPPIQPGDWIAVHDAGAYTLSMWSRYNSRSAPLALGVNHSGNELAFRVLKERETWEQVRTFWS